MNSGKLIDFLETVAEFSAKEKKLIFEHCNSRNVEKGAYLLSLGEVCNEVNFIIKGVVRFYILNDSGEELTTAFLSEGEIASRTESFLKGVPSNGYLRCETNCEFVTINRKSWNVLCEHTKNFGYAMGQIVSLSISKKMEMQRRILNEDARNSYVDFIKMHENVANRVNMKHIASYLGITPSSLSRIKKEITGI